MVISAQDLYCGVNHTPLFRIENWENTVDPLSPPPDVEVLEQTLVDPCHHEDATRKEMLIGFVVGAAVVLALGWCGVQRLPECNVLPRVFGAHAAP